MHSFNIFCNLTAVLLGSHNIHTYTKQSDFYEGLLDHASFK